MLTAAHKPLFYHPVQSALWRTKARFCAVVAGRGSGKTDIARRRIVRYLPIKKPWSNPVYAYALPTREMAKRIAWGEIKELIPKHWVEDINETELKIKTIYGSTLYVFGMDKPSRAEGLQYDGVVIDESSDQKPGIFKLTFLPALSHRRAWCWRIGVPKRFGSGAIDFKEFYDKGLKNESLVEGDPSMRVESFTWRSEDILNKVDPSIIEFARNTLDVKDYNEQYGASWETASGLIYYSYSDANIRPVKYDPRLPLLIGSDFNVSPMAWVVCQRTVNGLAVIDEIWLRDTNTQSTLDYLYRKYGQHKSGWEFYGDATGRARKTSAATAVQSDYLIIRADQRFKNAAVRYEKSNPAIVDRFAAVNALLCNVKKERRLLISPDCKQLKLDLGSRAYKENTREPDDSNKDSGHMTDALGYVVYKLFPVRAGDSGDKAQMWMGDDRDLAEERGMGGVHIGY